MEDGQALGALGPEAPASLREMVRPPQAAPSHPNVDKGETIVSFPVAGVDKGDTIDYQFSVLTSVSDFSADGHCIIRVTP